MSTVRRILFVAPLPPPVTGQSLACQALLHELEQGGIAVTVININKRTLDSGRGSWGRVREILLLLWRLVCDRSHYSLVYFTPAESLIGNIKDLAVYLILGKKLRSTFIHMHGGAGMRLLLSGKYPVIRAVNTLFLKRIRGAIVLGERLRLIYANIVPQDRVYVVKNFAHDELFVDWKNLRRKLKETSKLRLLYLSNLLPGKGYDDFLEAILALPGDVTARLVVDFAGMFESDQGKTEFLKRISGISFIRYHGPVYGEEKRRLLTSAHIFCLPTYYPYEGQPISILEAYASGCAVLTTDHSGILDIFQPGRNGLLVMPKNPATISNAILALIQQPSLIRRFALINALEARRKYRKKHHLKEMCKVLGLKEG